MIIIFLVIGDCEFTYTNSGKVDKVKVKDGKRISVYAHRDDKNLDRFLERESRKSEQYNLRKRGQK